jgi:hypothetical protein
MLPNHLVDEFWERVANDLAGRSGVGPSVARRAIARYREELARMDMPDLVYHREPAEVARDVMQGGFAGAETDAA